MYKNDHNATSNAPSTPTSTVLSKKAPQVFKPPPHTTFNMKFAVALLTTLLTLTTASPTPLVEKRQSVRPSFTHTWTDRPDPGFYTAATTGRVLFDNVHPISTHQTFVNTPLRNQPARIGFLKGSTTIAEGTRFRVHLSLPDLDLQKGVNKASTNNKRDRHLATFEVERGTGAVKLIELGTFTVPDRAKFTLEIVGDSKNPPVADFWFDTASAGLVLTRA